MNPDLFKINIIVEENLSVYPFMITPVFVSNQKNIQAINQAFSGSKKLLIAFFEEGSNEDFYRVGVVGEIMRKVALPDGRMKILFRGIGKAIIQELTSHSPLEGSAQTFVYKPYNQEMIEATLEVLREQLQYLANVNSSISPELLRATEEAQDPNRIVDLIASSLKPKKSQAYELFAKDDVQERLLLLIELIVADIENQKLQREIKSRVQNKMDKVNKEYFLKEQIRQIHKELGLEGQKEEEIERYRDKLAKIKPHINEEIHKEIKRQIDRLSKMNQDSGDANIIQNYIEWVLEIPFGKLSKEKISIQNVQKQLDSDHYSLEKPKKRIVEYFAVKELLALRGKESKDSKGTILCFYGPPGVGKTSLANSIAKAMGRSLVRLALGGLEDVNELRGHRRTYLGAMPGRITQGLIDAKSMDPVMVLDEIDKVGRSFRGDPTSVLLEILDPEQNKEFRDYYTNFNLDLSHVVFIATANDISQIPAPLKDRMEFIQISSYTPQEKEQIAKKYLIPQELKKHGLKNYEVSITSGALKEIIEKYTRESGVRNLRRQIATIMRKSAQKILLESLDGGESKVSINQKNLSDFLDRIVFEIDPADKVNRIGVVNGLAWTSVGGDVLKIEVVRVLGKGNLALTGSLGDVMKESARIAHSVIKVLLSEGKLDTKLKTPKEASHKDDKDKRVKPIYEYYDLHLHVPEGATPKDGPSAGIAMASVIASILSDRKIRADVAMTGELTLSGRVLPIGGLKEKLIAAYKAGVKKVLIPLKNHQRDLDEIPSEVKEGLEIIAVEKIEEVLQETLV
ncbi:endopeptidase La [Helicobacter pametensis]|uniref:endopeptidase La n=1 Tax=Helicobacter pametensis TaxID=95149 RepID=UPI0004830FE4|nr:endopeptidase La [Helicobacter pametensis]